MDKENMTSKEKANEFRRTHFTMGNYQSTFHIQYIHSLLSIYLLNTIDNPFQTEMKRKFNNQ